ncbi:hypothetical protein OQA88_12521 [Cercophora sp. LCS_1]
MELRLLLPLLLSSPILAAQPDLHWRSHLSANGTDFNGTTPFPSSSHNSTNTTIPEVSPPGNCRFSDQSLFENITLSCRDAISAVQTCPKPGASVQDLLRAATSFSDCFEKQFYDSYACKYWAPRKDGAISLWKPFGHPTLIEPIMREACDPLMKAVQDQFDSCCSSRSSRLDSESNSQVRNLVACMVQGSQQYVRCASTERLEGDVKSCVVASAPKAAYLPPGIFVYDGASVCKPFTFMMTYIAVAYAIDILELFTLRFKNGKLWLVPYPQQGFSLYRLLLHLITQIVSPFIMAAIISGPVYEASAINELALFLMAPRASPVIALICAFIPGWRGFGAQHLVSDIVFAFITIFGWGVVPGTAIETAHAAIAGASSALVNVYNTGVLLAVMPNWLTICLVILVVSCIVFFSSKGKTARRIGNIIAIAIVVAIVFASMPFVAIYEFAYGIKERRDQRKEWERQQQQQRHELASDITHILSAKPSTDTLSSSQPNPGSTPTPIINQRKLSRLARLVPKYFRLPAPDLIPPKPHLGWLKSIFRIFFPEDSPNARRWGYGLLLLSSFCITTGNWMATVTLLNMADEVFCPSNVWALVFAKLGISVGRILGDIVHVP